MDKTFLQNVEVTQLLFLIFVTLTFYIVLQSTFGKKLPPGPIGLPLLGYLPFLGKRPEKTFRDLGKKYGIIMSLYLGRELTIVLNEFKIAKEVLSNTAAFGRHAEIFSIIPEAGFSSKNGEEWHEQRSFCMHAMRDLGLGRGSWENMISEEVPEFLEVLKEYGGKPVDTRDQLALTVGGNILSLLIGKRLQKGKDDNKIKLTVDFSNEISRYLDPSNVGARIPILRKIFKFLKIGGYDNVTKVIDRFSEMISKDVINKHKVDEQMTDVKDFINLYLHKSKTMQSQGKKHFFTDANALGNIVSLFRNGSDTILSSLGWLFAYMAKYPDIQKRLQTELDDVIGQDGKISYEDRFKVPYTFAVMMEAQRCSSIVRSPIPRRALADIQVNGYTIPQGSSILTNFWAIHHDPEYFEEPEKFLPNRFLSDEGKKLVVNKPGFMAFSLGRRNCPGETVAWMEILIFFTSVMQKFTIRPPPGGEVILEPITGLVNYSTPQKLCFIER